jgi:xanthine dehydrogenase large subunit
MLGICAFLALWDAVAACGDGVTASDLDAPAIPERGLAAVQRQRAVAL